MKVLVLASSNITRNRYGEETEFILYRGDQRRSGLNYARPCRECVDNIMRIFFPHECRRDADGWNKWIYNGGERFPRTSTRPPRTRQTRNIHFARYAPCNAGWKIKALLHELPSPTGLSFVLCRLIIPHCTNRHITFFASSVSPVARIMSNWMSIARARLNSSSRRARELFRNNPASQIRNCEIKREGVRQ
ncbi:uncharacterized protein LOC105830612 [Monomorium pharaonis]|uniref:uncharacterized protein LOC105830612 n=1 Tax=Monomorium pharaonis TaxID=307658 RepID=UPI00063F0B79|nr:uncharacterized protein LOC105830612 [Monomorium pharaonis]